MLFTTGYPRDVLLDVPFDSDAMRLIGKPYTLEALAAAMAPAASPGASAERTAVGRAPQR